MLDPLLRGHASWAKLVRFGIAGLISSLSYALFTWTLVYAFRMSPVVSSAIGYALAIPLSFLLQRSFSFRSEGSKRRQAPRFMLVHGFNILVSIAVMDLLVSALGMDYRIGIAITMLLIPLLSFLAMNLWVFRSSRKEPGSRIS
ncbi:GtrA family protein [Pseudoxanthomonas yeongjuensis]|uniref:GtrA family protein n=1 Tax=Pseudoxanthomonas yeongjuensis TaxID=377616 RepID=UPI001391746B|nr:GtrA family protein [Pseudoxanthomonas yeongjuensis]